MEKNPGQISAYLDAWSLAKVKEMAEKEDRSVSWVVGFAVKQFFSGPEAVHVARESQAIADARHGRQVHLEDAIAAAVKRGPVKAAKHK
jgi:predicted transcriptional regulator